MKTFSGVILLFSCLALQSAVAERKVVQESESGKVQTNLAVDEFTKNKNYNVTIELNKDGIWHTAIQISPIRKHLAEDGSLADASFITFWHEKYGLKDNPKLLLIDGVSQPVEGAEWEKNLIAAIKKGSRIVVRAKIGDRTITARGSLNGFAKCWDVIPKEFISFANSAEKKDAPKTEKKEKKSPLRNWEAINGNNVEAEFVSLSNGQVTLRKSTGQTFKVPLNKLSKADQDYISKNSKLLDKKE